MMMKQTILLALFAPLVFGLGGNYNVVKKPEHKVLVGGFSAHDINNLEDSENSAMKEAADKAIELMNQAKLTSAHDKSNPLHLLDILSYETQVVAGINYRFVMVVQVGSEKLTCHLRVFKPLYSNTEDSWSVSTTGDNDPCEKFIPLEIPKEKPVVRSTVHLLGGDNEVDTKAEDVQRAAQFAAKHINSGSNSLFMQVLVNTGHATRQVINGYRYHMEIKLAETSCRNNVKNREKTLEECPPTNGGMSQLCDVSVISKDQKFEMESFKCRPAEDKPILGQDGHDYKPHVKKDIPNLQDFLPQRPYYHMPRRVNSRPLRFDKRSDYVRSMKIGGDDHDYLPHSGGCEEHKGTFAAFKKKHGKTYESVKEEKKRFQIFCENMGKIKMYQKQENGSAVYGVTKFADISEAEFKHTYLGFRPEMNQGISWPAAEIPSGPVPDSWDWRSKGAVTPVKNQGSCGSCWAFSTTGNIEGQYAIKSASRKLYSLSEQELVDCDKVDEGCNGGLPSQAYAALMKLGGIETEKDYKYDGYDEKCKFQKQDIVVKLTGAVNISQDEGEMAQWLYKNGPISIGINAFAMQFYLWGISHPWRIFCNPSELDHGVLIVGYGVDGSEPYWIIKNSWGEDWGRQGYYYVYRGDGTCGLNTMCTSAVIDPN